MVDAGGEVEHVRLEARGRQVLQVVLIEAGGRRRARRVDDRGIGRDDQRLGDRRDLQVDGDVLRQTRGEGDALDAHRLEAFEHDSDGIDAGRNFGEPELSLGAGACRCARGRGGTGWRSRPWRPGSRRPIRPGPLPVSPAVVLLCAQAPPAQRATARAHPATLRQLDLIIPASISRRVERQWRTASPAQ